MQFKIDGETFQTQNMVSIELEGVYLTVYLAPQQRLAFLQRFDDERGIVIQPATGAQTEALLGIYNQTTSPDISSHLGEIRDIVAPQIENRITELADDSGVGIPFESKRDVRQGAFRARR